MSGKRLRTSLCALGLSAALAGPAAAGWGIHLTWSDLEQLHVGEGSYELWAVVGGVPQSLGKFQMNQDNVSMTTIQGQPIVDNIIRTNVDLGSATKIMLTTEPEGDNNSTPAYHELAGAVTTVTGVDTVTNLACTDTDGMGVDFTSSHGTFILDTPTTASNTADWDKGVWFMTKCGSGAQGSLTLPTLPTGQYGWQYQGWVSDNSSVDPIPYSTGEFYNPQGADFDGAGCAAGPDLSSAPPLPGSDFVQDNGTCFEGEPTGAQDFHDTSWGVVVTVEPNPNTGPNPFAFKPLQLSSISSGAARCVSQNLSNTASLLPHGTATIFPTQTPVAPSTWGTIKRLYH